MAYHFDVSVDAAMFLVPTAFRHRGRALYIAVCSDCRQVFPVVANKDNPGDTQTWRISRSRFAMERAKAIAWLLGDDDDGFDAVDKPCRHVVSVRGQNVQGVSQ